MRRCRRRKRCRAVREMMNIMADFLMPQLGAEWRPAPWSPGTKSRATRSDAATYRRGRDREGRDRRRGFHQRRAGKAPGRTWPNRPGRHAAGHHSRIGSWCGDCGRGPQHCRDRGARRCGSKTRKPGETPALGVGIENRASRSTQLTLRISPAARRRTRELGVDPARLVGSGHGGAITIEDIEAARTVPTAGLN